MFKYIKRIILLFFVITFVIITLDITGLISVKGIIKNIGDLITNNLLVTKNKETEIILSVGKENIYKKDLDYELKNYVSLNKEDDKKNLINKIIKDSIILQGAEADGLVKLDKSVFNSPQKEYPQRMELVNEIVAKINSESDILNGGVVSLWFYNKGPGKIGYDKGRETAGKIITDLRSRVAGKKITLERAAQEIRNNPNLSFVDVAYLSNAYFKFNKNPSKAIVFDPKFDAVIKKLKTGEVSDVYLAKSKEWINGKPSNKEIDSVYMFAQIHSRKKNGVGSFESWYRSKAKIYAIKYL